MKKELLKYLKEYKIMSLATYGENPWVCWLFYVVDDDFNLYFVSPDDTQHIQDIQLNSNVACAITNSVQDPLGKKKGIQLWGTVEEVTGAAKLKTFFRLWKEVINSNEKKLTYQNYIDKAIASKVYKLTPRKIKWFNQELEETENVIEL